MMIPERLVLCGLLLATTGCCALVLDDSGACQPVVFIPFTDQRAVAATAAAAAASDNSTITTYHGDWPTAEGLARSGLSLVAVAEMARQHFNNRNPILVPELAQLGDCPVSLATPIYLDAGHRRSHAIPQLLELQRQAYTNSNGTASWKICATIGPVEAGTHAGLSTLTEAWNIPQLAYATIDQTLTWTDRYPTFVRFVADANHFARSLAQALHHNNRSNDQDDPNNIWQRSYVAVLHAEAYGQQIARAVDETAQTTDDDDSSGPEFRVVTEEVPSHESVPRAMQRIVEQGYRTLVVALDHQWDLLETIATEAVARNLVGRDYLWILTGHALPDAIRASLTLPADAPLTRLLDGSFVMTNRDPFAYQRPDGGEDAFLQAWRDQNATTALPNVLQRQPLDVKSQQPFFTSMPTAAEDYFATETPGPYASFLFDAVMSTGLSACRALADDGEKDHYHAMLQTPFTGASGRVQFAMDGTTFTANRDVRTTPLGLHNLRAVDRGENTRAFDSALVAVYRQGRWERTGEEFRYAGGSIREPLPLITVLDANYLSKGIQQMGFVLVALSLTIILVSALWVVWRRNDRRVKPGQPEFLYLLCFGSALVSVATIFVSFDEDKGWSTEQLSRACVAFPWFFVIGYMSIYAALAFKLWRLGQVMQMRRRAVTLRQMLLPLCAVFVSLLTILLLWLLLDPLQWERRIVDDDPRFTYGACRMEHGGLAFIVPLCVVILGAVAITARYSWMLRDIQPELAESRWIFIGIFGHLQLWILGIPLFIIADDVSKDVSYVVLATQCFVFSTTMVAFLIWPKIYVWYQETYGSGGPADRAVHVSMSDKASVRVSGLTHTTPAVQGSSGYQTEPTDSSSAAKKSVQFTPE